MVAIYTAAGLRVIAELLDEAIDDQELYSQNGLGELAGVAPNTIRLIRSNRRLLDSEFELGRYYKPGLETLLVIAPHVIDPLTGKGFDPERFERIARGKELLYPKEKGAISTPYPEAISLIKAAQERNPKAFKSSGLSNKALKEILSGKRPTWGELLQLAEAIFEDKDPEPLARMYGADLDQELRLNGNSKQEH